MFRYRMIGAAAALFGIAGMGGFLGALIKGAGTLLGG
jgi:hypothetical protein